MTNLLWLLVIVVVVVLIVRKLHIIAIAVFFGSILLMLSVTVLRDQLHIPINNYVNTQAIDDLRDKVVPIEFGENEGGKLVTVDKTTGEEIREEKINYDYISDEDRDRIIANLKGETPIEDDISNEILINTYENEKEETTKEILDKKEKDEIKNTVYEISYKNISKVREEWYVKLRPLISDENFYSKFMGMSPYVNIEYDLGNGKMYNSDDGKSLKILIYK